MEDVYDFGVRLKELRDKKGLTQEQIGKMVDVSGTSISGYENNIAVPPADILKRLALLYGVTTDYLYGLERRKTLVIDTLNPKQEKAMEQILEILKGTFEP